MELRQFFDKQIEVWNGCGQLPNVETRQLNMGDFTATLQHNPSRIVSTSAKIDAKSLQHRKCFLCTDGRLDGQMSLPITLCGDDYDILVNPYPILPYHFTIACRSHVPQRIIGREGVFMELLERFPCLTVFYNGPLSGASAPDHLHLQASISKRLPLQQQWNEIKHSKHSLRITQSLTICKYISPVYAISTTSAQELNAVLQHVISSLPLAQESPEPRLNIIAWREDRTYEAAIIPRCNHRPDCYFLDGEQKMLVSPGALDMAGLIITPRKEDFMRIESDDIEHIMQQCGCPARVPLSVGIMHRQTINVAFNHSFHGLNGLVSGQNEFSIRDNQIMWQGQSYDSLIFNPAESDATFTLTNVEIGTQFHWQQCQTETFHGSLQLLVDRDEIVVVNHIDVERYIQSVIGSEMSATSPIELLRAHALISRSWVISQIQQRHFNPSKDDSHGIDEPHLHVRWYDHDAHQLFDVCADDHCQRYQGIPKMSREKAGKAVNDTQNEILIYDNEIIDARFSKCCGGITESFDTCWDDAPKTYLPTIVDSREAKEKFCSVNTEELASKWIMSRPKTFCGLISHDTILLSLNAYDQQTVDAYRWTVEISQQELQDLLKEKISFSGGHILSLTPLRRGASGRISLLRIQAETDYIDIGKELEIRRVLSKTHLYSSAFTVETVRSTDADYPDKFVLHGAGWGHGVGLCQMGAAEMAAEGYDYKEILHHYYLCEIVSINDL